MTAQTCAYLRVSSRAQDYPTQRAAIERMAGARGDRVVTWYAEKRSGKTMARLELDRLRTDARQGKIGKLYIFRLDRLTRSGIRDTFELVEELRRDGVQLVSVSDGFDLEGPCSEVVLAVMAWAAKMERLAINERISAARDRLEAEGRPWGRPRRMGNLDCAQAAQLRSEGCSVRQIAQTLRVPRSTVALALSRKAASPEPP